MKKTTVTLLRFAVCAGLTGSLIGAVQAQKTPDTGKPANIRVHVKVIERSGGNVTETERTYRADESTSDKRDEVVKNLVDSLKMARKGDSRQQQMTIIIEDNVDAPNRLTLKQRRLDGDKTARLRNYSWPNNRNFEYRFRADIDSAADRVKRFDFSFPNDLSLRLAEPFAAWSRDYTGKPATVRALEAYPNNPDRSLLNIRFSAPATGDVSIVVTNTKGKEVARKDVKAFSGDYVGQIDLGKNALGTYFITVTQNDDGAVKRIVVQ